MTRKYAIICVKRRPIVRIKIHSLARKYEHLRINQIQLRFLHFNQHSITLLGIHMRHLAYKRETYTFINANIKVINSILKVNRDNRQTLKCTHYSLTFLWHCNSIAFLDKLRMDKTNINALVQSIEHSSHLHLLLLITRKYAMICVKRRPIVLRYFH